MPMERIFELEIELSTHKSPGDQDGDKPNELGEAQHSEREQGSSAAHTRAELEEISNRQSDMEITFGEAESIDEIPYAPWRTGRTGGGGE